MESLIFRIPCKFNKEILALPVGSEATFNDLKAKIIEEFKIDNSKGNLTLSMDGNLVDESLNVVEILKEYGKHTLVLASFGTSPRGK
jgi:hypothetical protein